MSSFAEVFLTWFSSNKGNLFLTFLIVGFYFSLNRIALPKLGDYVEHSQLKSYALRKAVITLGFFSGILSLFVILFVWGFDFKGLLTLTTGLIALMGAALFASWSILSNITAFFLLLAHQSFKRGNYIRVIDGDNYIEGYISEINIFNTRLISESREVIVYPNNLLIARPTVVNSKTRYNTVGKTQEFSVTTGTESKSTPMN